MYTLIPVGMYVYTLIPVGIYAYTLIPAGIYVYTLISVGIYAYNYDSFINCKSKSKQHKLRNLHIKFIYRELDI